MPSRRRLAALLVSTVLLTSPASTQVQAGAITQAAKVVQVPSMPNLVGLRPDSANKLLARYHRQIDSVHRVTSKPPLGIIVSQSPNSGSPLRAGIPITVRVATLPGIVAAQVPKPAKQALAESLHARVPQAPTMPGLISLTPDSANKLLARYRREIDSIYPVVSPSPAGTIVGQSPDPGSLVEPGRIIAVRVARPPLDDVATRVPALVGRTSPEVAELLKSARLTAGPIDFVIDRAHAARVVRQLPPPDSVVPRGTQVSLTYGKVDSVTVPRVLDMPPEDARRTLEKAGLSLGGLDSAAGKSRTVIRQDPLPNTGVPRGSPVRLAYTFRRLVVPDLSRSTVDSASRTLARVGLSLGQINSVATDGDTGRVVAQRPAPATLVDSGTRVSITVGRARPAIVPYVVGRTLADAELMLAKARLRVGPATPQEADGPAGVILAQHPESGVVVQPQLAVSLWVSAARPVVPDIVDQGGGKKGPAVDSASIVPDLTKRTLDEARALLAVRRLTMGDVRYEVRERGDSTVYWQNLPGGTRRPPGTAVDVKIGVPRSAVTVPDVVGLDSAQAQRVLADSGFLLAVGGTEQSDRRSGTVLSQSPGAGEPGTPGTPVSVRFANQRVLLVPGVLGMRTGDAESALAAAGLAVRSDTQLAFGADGIVTDQSPGGGTIAARGLVVNLTIGRWPAAWLWAIAVITSLGATAAASGPVARHIRDWRWGSRLAYVPVTAAGTHALDQSDGALLRPDLQLQPVSPPATHELEVEGPLFPEDAS